MATERTLQSDPPSLSLERLPKDPELSPWDDEFYEDDVNILNDTTGSRNLAVVKAPSLPGKQERDTSRLNQDNPLATLDKVNLGINNHRLEVRTTIV